VTGEAQEGWVDAGVQAEFPDLRLWRLDVEATPRRSPPEIRHRLRDLSDGVRGNQAVTLRRQAVPHAYRVFFRHVGLDPDRDLPPQEALVLERLKHGHFRSKGLIDDAITIATVETGVALWALDADAVGADLGIRVALPEEEVAGLPVPAGRLVIADEATAVAVLFGALGAPVSGSTRRVALFSVQVAGVPSIHVDEALWTAGEILSG
jgi:DNA/RNA-binding domain of Phe-tRNA-synthetase-like protein